MTQTKLILTKYDSFDFRQLKRIKINSWNGFPHLVIGKYRLSLQGGCTHNCTPIGKYPYIGQYNKIEIGLLDATTQRPIPNKYNPLSMKLKKLFSDGYADYISLEIVDKIIDELKVFETTKWD